MLQNFPKRYFDSYGDPYEKVSLYVVQALVFAAGVTVWLYASGQLGINDVLWALVLYYLSRLVVVLHHKKTK